MMDSLKVYVVAFGDRATYQLQWKDPNTGKKKTRSTKIPSTGRKKEKAEAERAAADLETALASNYVSTTKQISWEAFRDRYEKEVGGSLAETTLAKIVAVFNSVENHINPGKLAHLTEERISFYAAAMREAKRSESSIKSYLAHLKASLRWAARMKLITAAPGIAMPSRATDRSKGRPVTGEEFDRMAAAVSKVPEADDAAAWQRLLRGLWLSGLRIGEALNLWWDRDDRIRVELGGRRPMLFIPSAMEKGNRDRTLPITPDFAAMLAETPADERKGRVFPLHSRRAKGQMILAHRASIIIAKIGKKAGVKVGGTAEKPKYASAHDLRRSFGERWASRVMPQVLMEMMRHEDMATTMRFYVGRNAERTADAIWNAFPVEKSNKLANSQEKEAADPVKESAEDVTP